MVAMVNGTLSPWSNFDLDAIVRSFPETPVPVQLPEPPPPQIPQIGNMAPWNEETDVLFGLMGNEFEGMEFKGHFLPRNLAV